MYLIGQINLKAKLDSLIELNNFPKVFTVVGKSGFGKSSVVSYIADKLNISDIIELSSIDTIRDAMLYVPNITHPVLLHVTSFEGLNFRAKETLLKLCEDVPNNVYIALEVTNLSLCEDRFINRSQVFELGIYSKQELENIIRTFNPDILQDDISKLLSMVGSPKEFKQAIDYGVDGLHRFMTKVSNNILKAQAYNAMKIADNISLKSDDNKIPILLFLNILKNMSFRTYLTSNDLDALKVYNSAYKFYEELIACPKVNKRALFDNFIFSLKG